MELNGAKANDMNFPFNKEKTIEAAHYLYFKNNTLGLSKLEWLLCVADKISYWRCGRPITGASWINGYMNDRPDFNFKDKEFKAAKLCEMDMSILDLSANLFSFEHKHHAPIKTILGWKCFKDNFHQEVSTRDLFLDLNPSQENIEAVDDLATVEHNFNRLFGPGGE